MIQTISSYTVFSLLQEGRETLLRAGIEEAQEESERVLMKLSGFTRSELYLKASENVFEAIAEQFLAIIEQRRQRIPLAYLLQEADFGRETLFVNEHCLIPRPETEILAEKLIENLKKEKKEEFSLLDIGTGSGAIAIALLRVFEKARATLLDISPEALEVADRNLKKYSLENRTTLVLGDLFEPFEVDKKWDVIVSNPPYLAEADWNTVQEELKFEPRQALDGGYDGLELYRRIIAAAKSRLSPLGRVVFEVGQGQAGIVSKWLREAGYDNIQVFEDYSRIPRVVIAKKGF